MMIQIPFDIFWTVALVIWSITMLLSGAVCSSLNLTVKIDQIYEYLSNDKSDEWVHIDTYTEATKKARKIERKLKTAEDIAKLHEEYMTHIETQLSAKDAKIACLDAENCKLKLKIKGDD